jgi:hypothetical protein
VRRGWRDRESLETVGESWNLIDFAGVTNRCEVQAEISRYA